MSETVNFSIDLGTTNSVIAHCEHGQVEVFKNPMGLKEVLPSVVAFRRERILVGDKARELLQKDPSNVVGLFKRKMGTTHLFPIQSLEKKVSPTELSSYVLKELKNFVPVDKEVDEVVITIPASFDTVQSNATQKAGELAGFNSVTLLQEPIAASLAFVNKAVLDKSSSGYWIVYDLGGGTFDVALIKLEDGEMTVVDHAGDNFLGGTDFDQLILDKIIVPSLQQKGTFSNLDKELKSASGKYNKLFYKLLYKCEELKIQLSSMDIAELEFDVEDDTGEFIDVYMEITRDQFDAVIEQYVIKTTGFITQLLASNNMTFQDIEKILMIGGSTYIPLVREKIRDISGGKVDYSVDPTTAVAVGSAYYAGAKKKSIREAPLVKEDARATNLSAKISLKTAFQRQTQESEEYFVAKVSGDFEGNFYRITRVDGGFDTGLKPLKNQIEEDLPLLTNTSNEFLFKVFDAQNNKLSTDFDQFSIVQGKFGVLGQPLPADICLEVDDVDEKETRLEVIFEKNAVLPLKKRLIKEVGTTIQQASKDALVINILEGKQYASPGSNKPIGIIQIAGKDLERDLLKGTDVEITVEMTESRELRVYTYLSMTGQEFENVFTASERFVDIEKLKMEINELVEKTRREKQEAEYAEDYKKAGELKVLENESTELFLKISATSEDDVTDVKFQVEDAKRDIWYKLDELTSHKKLSTKLKELHGWIKNCEEAITTNGLETEKTEFENLNKQVKLVIDSGNSSKIKSLTEQFRDLYFRCQWKDPEHVKHLFFLYAFDPIEFYTNKDRAKKLIERGEKAAENNKIEELRSIIHSLNAIHKDSAEGEGFINRTGLV